MDALTRQHPAHSPSQVLFTYVLAAERQGVNPSTLGDALAELLAHITEAPA